MQDVKKAHKEKRAHDKVFMFFSRVCWMMTLELVIRSTLIAKLFSSTAQLKLNVFNVDRIFKQEDIGKSSNMENCNSVIMLI